jgi:hypothetical protein
VHTADNIKYIEADELYILLHLVCTICRAIILGYNAIEKSNASNPKHNSGVTFSELASAMPTGK